MYLYFKGIFFELAPVTIPLCVEVLVQNTVLFVDYYKERTKLVPSFFMGIALADILKAQGEIVLAVTSILAYTGVCVCDVEVLFRSLFYYMVTALPGINCSKVFNLALTLCFTVNVVNPFRRINSNWIKKTVFVVCMVVTCLHLLDTIIAIVGIWWLFSQAVSFSMRESVFLLLLDGFNFPGIITIAAIICGHEYNTPWQPYCGYSPTLLLGFEILAAVLYIVVPPLIVLVCMLIQIKYLRRTLHKTPRSAHYSQTLPVT